MNAEGGGGGEEDRRAGPGRSGGGGGEVAALGHAGNEGITLFLGFVTASFQKAMRLPFAKNKK